MLAQHENSIELAQGAWCFQEIPLSLFIDASQIGCVRSINGCFSISNI